jgi:hypothetical protein
MSKLKIVLLSALISIVVIIVILLFFIPLSQTFPASVHLYPYESHKLIFNDTQGSGTEILVMTSGGQVSLSLSSPTGQKIIDNVEVTSSYYYDFNAPETGTYMLCIKNPQTSGADVTIHIIEERSLISFL